MFYQQYFCYCMRKPNVNLITDQVRGDFCKIFSAQGRLRAAETADEMSTLSAQVATIFSSEMQDAVQYNLYFGNSTDYSQCMQHGPKHKQELYYRIIHLNTAIAICGQKPWEKKKTVTLTLTPAKHRCL